MTLGRKVILSIGLGSASPELKMYNLLFPEAVAAMAGALLLFLLLVVVPVVPGLDRYRPGIGSVPDREWGLSPSRVGAWRSNAWIPSHLQLIYSSSPHLHSSQEYKQLLTDQHHRNPTQYQNLKPQHCEPQNVNKESQHH